MADETVAGSRYGTAAFEEIDQLLGDVNPRNTHNTTKFAVKLLYDYCNSKGRNPEFENLTAVQLNALLKRILRKDSSSKWRALQHKQFVCYQTVT